ncbi:hypothetical protein IWQ61_010410, partial [Dispira simplex]
MDPQLGILGLFMIDEFKGIIPKKEFRLLGSMGHHLMMDVIWILGLLENLILSLLSSNGMEMGVDDEHMLDMSK